MAIDQPEDNSPICTFRIGIGLGLFNFIRYICPPNNNIECALSLCVHNIKALTNNNENCQPLPKMFNIEILNFKT